MIPTTNTQKKVVLIGILLCLHSLWSQEGAAVKIDAFPPAPTPSSLGKFANVPVSTYTGVPNITIPIWEVKDGGISLPISLSYHARGIQVDELASWVGLGWALQAGGVITRTVRGLPDDLSNGFLSPNMALPASYNNDQNERFAQYADGYLDSQPDQFTFNFAGKSGNFQFDNAGNIYIVPFQKIKIEPIYKSSLRLGEWKITAEDGFIYRFEVRERGRVLSQCNGAGTMGAVPYYTSTWYLTSITAPTGAIVSFEYKTAYAYAYPVCKSETKYSAIAFGNGTPMTDTECFSLNEITEGVRLRKIKSDMGEVEFVATKNRYDLPGDASLDEVIIRDYNTAVLRRFRFNYQYMYANSLVAQPGTFTNADAIKYRLALTSVQEFDADGIASKPAYKFEYALGLPSRMSNAVDHWGFYNGLLGNTTSVPEEIYDGRYFSGADKNVSLEHAQMGTLNKITYPTGGTTSFVYEQNEASQGLPKSAQRSVSYVSGYFNGVWNKVPERKAFEINSVGGDGVWVRVNFSTLPCGQGGEPYNGCGMYFAISKNVNGNLGEQVFHSWSVADLNTRLLFLPNGQYFIHTGLTGYDTPSKIYHGFDISVRWREMTGEPDYWVGGLRLAKMIDTDPILNKTLVKHYEYKIGATGATSGSVSNTPFNYAYLYQTERKTVFDPVGGGSSTTRYDYTLYRVQSSKPNVPMGLTQGCGVGYKEVSIYHGEKSVPYGLDRGVVGKSVYKYTSPADEPDRNAEDGFPFPALESRDWSRGLLLEATDYKRVGSGYVPVKRISNTYHIYNELSSNVNLRNNRGLKVGWYTRGEHLKQFVYKYYDFYTGYVEKTGSTETLYNTDGSQSFSKSTKTDYSTLHLQPVKTTSEESDGSKVNTLYTYPLDYTDGSGFINGLKAANIISLPIEEVSYREDANGSNPRILSGKLNTYKQLPLGAKDQVYLLEAAQPIPSANFRFSNRSSANVLLPLGSPAPFYINPSYKLRAQYDKYDAKGNLLQYTQDGLITSLLWGYKGTLPIAQVNRASRGYDVAAESQFLWNGFEQGTSPGEYGWYDFDASKVLIDRKVAPDNVHSGRYGLRINAATAGTNYGPTADMNPPSPQQGKYKLSAWVKTPVGFPSNSAFLQMYAMKKGVCCANYPNIPANSAHVVIAPTNGQWKYVEATLDFEQIKALAPNDLLSIRCYIGNSSSSHPIYVDDLRIHPTDALMKTYTFDPQVGISSMSSIDGKLNLYEYDGLGRLQLIKDQDGNILKTFSYVFGSK